VRAAALALLNEQPMNGYQIIQEIGERSGGVWRPSPGSIYPALQQLEDEGLIQAEAAEGRRAYQLTDEGRSYVEAHPEEVRAPWDVVAGSVGDSAIEMRNLIGQVAMAAFQVVSAGTEAQVGQAREVLTDTRKALYRLHGATAAAPRIDDPVISVSGLTKQYGEVPAVRGIDFEVARGETFGFLGPNGAGKTTTIKILCTLANATSGTARVAGHDAMTERDSVRRNIGLVFQDTTLDTYLTAEQNLRFHAELYGVPKAAVAPRMRQVMDMVGLWDRKDSLVSTYSGGMQRRLEIARGLLHAPRVLFLDEPTVGLDPQTRSSIWTYINELKRREDITIFLTTHYMDEAENCDRIAIIDHGKIVAIDTPEALKASVGKDRVQIQTADDPAAIATLAETFGVEAAMHEGAVTFSVAAGEQFVPRLFAEFSVPIRSVSVSRPSLDDVFMSYTGSTIRDAEASGTDAMRQMVQRFRAGRR
jgi:ABC-2 type transport system ATP-binding protein